MTYPISNLFAEPPLWFALLLASVVAGIAWSMRWLTARGALATACLGFIIFGFGGGAAAVPLLAFFISSSLLSKIGKARKARASGISEKGDTRDAGQVCANGGIAALLVLAHRFFGAHWSADQSRMAQSLFLAALATVNADTWATEIGGLWGGLPRLLSNWRRVAPGVSGAISLPGTAAAVAGAIFIPLCVNRLWLLSPAEFLAIAWAGFMGCFLDSILGASVQAQYKDPATGNLTEDSQVDGRPSTLIRGLRWINNDAVNFLAASGGVFFAWVLLHYGLRGAN